MATNELPELPPHLHWHRWINPQYDTVRDAYGNAIARVWHYSCGTEYDAEIFTPPEPGLEATWCQRFDNADDARRVLAMRLWLGEFT